MQSATKNPQPELQALTPIWDSARIRKLIDASEVEGGPAILEVGKVQKLALINHLTAAFGSDSMGDSLTKRDLYYMGLRVEEKELESHLAVSGQRRMQQKKRSDDALEKGANSWQFRA